MSAFGGLILTNVGRNLQAKAQAGTALNFTRIAVGDGELGSSSIADLTALKNQIKSLSITKFKSLTDGKAVIGGVLSNSDLTSGFYWRELGVFATDPDLGEILYCYGNSGSNAEYIPAGGGSDIVEKSIDIVTIVGNATSVSATINSSLVYVSQQDYDTGMAGKISHSLATALNDFLVASGPGQFIKKTLTEVKTILGLGSAAYKDAGEAGGVALYDTVNEHLSEKASSAELGHVKQGTGVSIDSNGVLSVASGSAAFKKNSSTFTTRGTSQTFTDAGCTTNSLIIVAITSSTKPQGIWSVDSADGSFTITSTASETADITFDYYILKAVA